MSRTVVMYKRHGLYFQEVGLSILVENACEVVRRINARQGSCDFI